MIDEHATPIESGSSSQWGGLFTAPSAPVRARIARAIMHRAFARVPVRVEFPDGTVLGAGGVDAPTMVVHRPEAFLARLGAEVKIGFGEAYMVGDWDVAPGTDLADLLDPFARRLTRLVPAPLQKFRAIAERRQPRRERNTVEQAGDNISRHYDLSNEMFAAFLDETMTYSSALFADGDDLAAAQRRKIDSVLDMAEVTSGSEVLEIGTGWGQLALQAAQRGARVTTLTLSAEQRALAMGRLAAAGVADRVEVRLQDYRSVTGSYDAVVSVEMIEAVGYEFWPEYFATIDRLLRPGGAVGLQAITMEHDRMMATRNSYTWIHKYIFPGGIIPSIRAIEDILAKHTSLRVDRRLDFGHDYARTLHCWREKFLANFDRISSTRFDGTFRRMWEFYLAYCEAGFRADYLGVSQLRLVH